MRIRIDLTAAQYRALATVRADHAIGALDLTAYGAETGPAGPSADCLIVDRPQVSALADAIDQRATLPSGLERASASAVRLLQWPDGRARRALLAIASRLRHASALADYRAGGGRRDASAPVPGTVYRLTGTGAVPAISNGDAWSDCAVGPDRRTGLVVDHATGATVYRPR